jgi:fibronectin type 3 domain-containing protein
MASVLAAPLAAVAGAEDANLLRPGAGDQVIDLPDHALAAAARAGRINPAALRAKRIRVELPDGTLAIAEREREVSRNASSISWIGHFDDQPGSILVLTSHRGAITGSMYYGPARYELEPQRSGGHVLFKVDESRIAPDVALAPPMTTAAQPENVQALPNIEPYATSSPGYIHDVLVVYTQAARARWGQATLESKIVNAVELANQAYRNSQVDILLHLTGMVEISYAETGDMAVSLARLQAANDGYMDSVHSLRNSYGADLVSLISEDTNYCGIAYIMKPESSNFASAAFSVVASQCLANGAFAHEIGHNQGDAHDRATATAGGEAGGTFAYSYGYRRCATDGSGFRTVMAYQAGCSGGNFVAYFSNPDVLVNGYPSGIDYETDPANSADNARSMNNTADTVAAFRAGSSNTVPNEPTGLGATTISGSQINLVWTDNASNETGFRVERSTNGTTFTEIAVLAANSVTYSSTGLTAGATYWYRVRAYNSKGNSGYSNVASAQATPPQPPPAAPGNLQATPLSTSSIGLSWADNADNETGFIIQKATTSGDTSWVDAGNAAANATAQTVTALAPATEYRFRVFAANGTGNSEPSNIATATTPSLVGAPASPSGLLASSGSPTTVALQWNDNSNNETGFTVHYSTGSTWFAAGSVSANTTTFTHQGRSPATKYFYRVTADNATGSSTPSNTAGVTTLAALPPAAPTGLTASTVSASSIALEWLDNADNEDDFEIESSASGSDGWSTLAIVSANTTSYTDTGLPAATTRWYRVRARNGIGVSPFSNEAQATTSDPLAPPTGLAATAQSAESIQLTWTDAASAETGFELQRRILSGWQLVATLPADATGYSDAALAAETTYQYRIRAAGGGQFSAYSNVTSATTAGPARPLPGRTSRDLAALDVNGDGAGDLAVLGDGTTNRVRLIDGVSGQETRAIDYLSTSWLPIAIGVLSDSNADAVLDDPSIALLAHNPQTAKHTVQIRRTSDGELVRSISYFSSGWQVLDAAVVDDSDGNGLPGDAGIAVLAFQPSTDKISVQLRRAEDGSLVRTVNFLSPQWTPIAVEGLARPGSTPLLAVLAVKSGDKNQIVVQSRRVDDGELARNTYFLSNSWVAQDLATLTDPDGNPSTVDPAFAVLASEPSTGGRQVEIRDATTGAVKKRISYLGAGWRVIAAAEVPSLNANTRPEVGVLAENPVTGKFLVQLRDYGSAALVKNITIPDAAKSESWIVRLFNSDDTAALILNGQPAGSCGGADECSVDITRWLLNGANALRIEIGNAANGWAYGYEISRDGITWAEDSCGVANSTSCQGSIATGTVLSRDLNVGY